MQVTPTRPTGSFFQQIRQSLPACVSWTRVQGAFSSLAGCFRSKPTPLTERQVVREQLFPEGLVEKTCSRCILKQIQHNRIEFTEHNSAPRYFENADAFSKYLKSRVAEISFWRIELEGSDRVFYKSWDELEGAFVDYPTKNALYYALSKDAGGAFKVIDRSSGTTTFVRNRSGYFTLAFEEFESEAQFLETTQLEKKRRAFLLKCFAGLATGAAVGAGTYTNYSHQQTEEHTNAVTLPHFMVQAASRTTFVPLSVLPNITLIEEIPYQSKNWIISDLFGSAMNGAVVSANIMPNGLQLINQQMSVVNSIPKSNNKWVMSRKDDLLYLGEGATTLAAIDISDPLNLITINRVYLETSGAIGDLSIGGNYSYLSTSLNANVKSFVVVDLSDPLNMKIASTIRITDTTGYIPAAPVANVQETCYMLVSNALYAYDMRDHSSPMRVGSLANVGSAGTDKIAISGTDCVITFASPGTMNLIDITIPTSLKFAKSISIPPPLSNACPLYTATETHLFLAEASTNDSGTLFIYDITQRTTPYLVSTLTLPIKIWSAQGDIAKDNDLCYISTNGALYVIDVSDLAHPILINTAFSDDSSSGQQAFLYKEFCFFHSPGGLQITPRGNTLSLYGTPAGGTQGHYVISLSALNKQGKSSKGTFNLFVKPAITVESTIPDQLAVVGSNFNFFISANTFQHVNRNVLTYSADPLPHWLRFNPNSGSFSGSPGPSDAKNIDLLVSATDGNGATASTHFNLRVVYGPKLNTPIAEQVAKIGSSFSFTFPVDTFIDKDGDVMEYSATNSGVPLPDWLTFDASQRRFYGIPRPSDSGKMQLILTARAPNGLTASTIAPISVVYGPSFNLPIKAQVAQVGKPFSFTFSADTFLDLDGTPLSYTATNNSTGPLPSWILQFSSVQRTFSGLPQTSDAGIVPIKLTARDNNGLTAETSFQIKVVHGPSLNRPISNLAARINEEFSFTFPADTFSDRDEETLKYTATNNGLPLPAWLHFDPVQRTFSGIPLGSDTGTVQVVLQAKDSNGLVAETYFQIQAALPTPLTLVNPIANQIALVGQLFKFYVPSNTFVASPGLVIYYSAKMRDGSVLPSWLTFINQTFSGTPGRGDTGTFSDRVLDVSLTATAGAGISSHIFNINVSGESYTLLVLKVVGPFLSGIGAAYAIYQKRAVLLNCWNKKKYQRAAATAIIGQPFSRSLSVRGSHVRAIVVRHSGKLLAQNGQLPHGFRYNHFTNAIESDNVPNPGSFKILTIQVIGDADKILEQFTLQIVHRLQDVLVDAKESAGGQQGRVYVQMDDLSSDLLSDS